jgi:hypothetical protein
MPQKTLPERRNPLRTGARNEAVVLFASSSGRTVGFIVDIGRRSIPFGNPVAEKYNERGNILDTLMDGSFLPFDTDAFSKIEDLEFSDMFYNLGNKLRLSLQVKDLTGNHLSELEYFMQHIDMTEN